MMSVLKRPGPEPLRMDQTARQEATVFSGKTFLSVSIVFLLCAGVFGAPAGAATAQGPDAADASSAAASQGGSTVGVVQPGSEPEAGMAAELSQQHERLLKMALGGCFEQPSNVAPGTTVTIGFDLDDQGRLSGIPEPLGDGAATADMRRLYLSGVTSLDGCSPYPPEGKSASFEAVFSNEGIFSLRRTSASSDGRSGSVGRTAAAVHRPATRETEDALALDRSGRAEVQLRLQLLGFDPKGTDGLFGQNSRDAISSWQGEKGFPVTGFLNAIQLLALNAQSQVRYAEYIAKNPEKVKRMHRVKVCQNSGFLGIRKCQYENRWY